MTRSPNTARAVGRALAVAVAIAAVLRVALWLVELGMRLGERWPLP